MEIAKRIVVISVAVLGSDIMEVIELSGAISMAAAKYLVTAMGYETMKDTSIYGKEVKSESKMSASGIYTHYINVWPWPKNLKL